MWLSVPIMLGSAGQNLIALTDSLFLYGYDENDFAAVGFISVFYLVLSAIGFGFSKGGQILIARKYGDGSHLQVNKFFYAILIFELILGVLLFLCLKFYSKEILSLFVQSEIILNKSIEFLKYRSYGLIFSFAGLSLLSLYMGIGKPRIILIDTVFLGLVNLMLCYVLVYGKFGFPEMGISGAGLASTISEAAALLFFIGYMALDSNVKPYRLGKLQPITYLDIRNIIKIGIPIMFQSMIGIASWFIFFSFIEKLGERALAISNLLRVLYLVFSIPCWGFASAINTMVSRTIGRGRETRVLKQVFHSSIISLLVTGILSFPFLIFSQIFLQPLLGGEHGGVYDETQPYLSLLYFILLVASFSIIYFNGVSGTGEGFKGLNIQLIGSICYLLLAYISIIYPNQLGLRWAWISEMVYWGIQCALSWWVLKSGKWYFIKF
ncbi:MAG: MATE family efflux transporter [Saprospiraceae bacterium]|nr:MATE family efflux transporter [Saprospiraceae bacterium]